MVGLAREQVAAARAAVGEQPVAVAWRRSISAQSGGAEQVIMIAALLLDPAERRDVLVGAEQDAGLAGPVCDERSVSHSTSRACPRRASAPSSGALPSRIARCRTGRASPSISR